MSAAGGLHGTVMIPQGLNFNVREALGSNGFLGSSVPDMRVDVNKFYIDYRPTGEVGQFHSDLTIVDSTNNNEISKTISVNDPLRYEGVTMYQTDWGISAIQVRVDGSEPFNLVMAQLQKGDNKLFGTYLPLGEKGTPEGKGISILARDLQSAVIYDKDGQFVGVRRPGSKKPIQVDNVSIVVDDLIGSTGLELKMDPGVPLVYTGFGGLMFTTTISYLSHSQVNLAPLLPSTPSLIHFRIIKMRLHCRLCCCQELVKSVESGGLERSISFFGSRNGIGGIILLYNTSHPFLLTW